MVFCNNFFFIYPIFAQIWTDVKLKWNVSDYGGLDKIHMADHEIWQPDLFLLNR